MQASMLYPVNTACRTAQLLDGMWRFRFDPQEVGKAEGWPEKGLPASISMPVPASFSDIFTTKEERDYCGDFWYETEFYLPGDAAGKKQYVRFGSVTHRCVVYCNGVAVAQHEGGFLPVVADVTEAAKPGVPNRLVVWVNNELNETNMPCGATMRLRDGRKFTRPYFDFFNYSGIHRSVWLVQTATEAVQDYELNCRLDGADALVDYTVTADGDKTVRVTLADAEGDLVAEAEGRSGTLTVKDAKLWKVRNAYLYTVTIQLLDGGAVVDEYRAKAGLRTVALENGKFCVNGEPVYLKGFGKHEDFDVLGKGFNGAVAKRDYECLKWINANCFRTSHYPYAEEWYQMADEEGFLIIDEVPAVGLMRSFTNYMAAGMGEAYTGFFKSETIGTLQQRHFEAVREMIARDKNHPSVIAWSMFNEPETTSTYARDYFAPVFELARQLDPQHRPITGVLEKSSSPQHCQVYPMMDFICLNRYYGWYIAGGDLNEARAQFEEEMDAWLTAAPGVPIIFTEYGTDTLETSHRLPSMMWTQEYQNEYMEMYFEVFDKYDNVQGELAWNFADFMTGEGLLRVGGNKKGVFTRERQPKQVAHLMRERWKKM